MPQAGQSGLIVVDDEAEIRELIADYLGRNGFEVRGCASGAELDDQLSEERPALVMLDISMPGEGGLSILRRIRETSDVPVILLTALDDVVDRVVGLELGADDYLTKPFDLRELLARIRAVIRRTGASGKPAGAAPREDENLVSFGEVYLNMEGYCLVDREGRSRRLTATEYELLAAFARNPNRVLSRDRLMDLAGGRELDPFDRSIDIRIARIRKKVERDASKPQVIRTVRGAGYIYVPART